MTHFRCAVFSYDPSQYDNLLAKFSETDEKFFEFIPIDIEELKERYENWGKNYYNSFEEYLTDNGYINSPDDGSVIGYMANPNAKWDWYSLDGGRWQFDLKPGEECDDRGEERKNQFTYVDADHDEVTSTERYNYLTQLAMDRSNPEYEYANSVLEEFPTLEEYLEDAKSVCPYAYITPDGVWHSAGDVGWFGTSTDDASSRKAYREEWKKWIDSPDNPYVNFVDCHI